MDSESVKEWLSGVGEPPGTSVKRKRYIEDLRDIRAFKRRKIVSQKLSPSQRGGRRTESEPPRLRPALWDPSPSVDDDNPEQHNLRSSKSVDSYEMGDNFKKPGLPSPEDSKAARSRNSSRSDSASNATRSRSESGSRATSDAIASSTYRWGVLRPNGVRFKFEHDILPENVARHRDIVALRPRNDSSTMTSEDARRLAIQLREKENGEESKIENILKASILVPPTSAVGLQINEKSHFNVQLLPKGARRHVEGFLSQEFATISQPKPDLAYGYQECVFDVQETDMFYTVMTTEEGHPVNLRTISQPAPEIFWPFLIVEAKAQAKGTNCYQASNQCAGGGSSCLNSIATLNELARQATGKESPCADSVAYSLAIDSEMAILYIHWREFPTSYFLQRIDTYLVRKSSDLVRLSTHLRNIVDWGLGTRLEQVRASLNDLSEMGEKRKRSHCEVER